MRAPPGMRMAPRRAASRKAPQALAGWASQGPRICPGLRLGFLCHPSPPMWAVVILKALPLRDRKGELGTPPPVPLYFFIIKKLEGHAVWHACRTSLTRGGTRAPALEVRSLNHWMAREVLCLYFFKEENNFFPRSRRGQ